LSFNFKTKITPVLDAWHVSFIICDMQTLAPMKRTVENIRDPLFRFFEREVNAGIQMLASVRRDIEDAIFICLGEKKQTNHHRILLAALAKSQS